MGCGMSKTPVRVSLIKAVTTPLGFFVFVLSIVELTLIGNIAIFPPEFSRIIVISAVVIIILIILLVATLAVFWPGALQGQSEVSAELMRSIGADVCTAFDAYISNLESAGERNEAWKTLIQLVKLEGAVAESENRKAMAKVIHDRSIILNR